MELRNRQGQNRFERRLHLRPLGAGAPGSFEPVGSPRRTPNTSPTESVTRRGSLPLQVGRGCSTTDSGKVVILPRMFCYHPRSSQGPEGQLQSGKEGDTALGVTTRGRDARGAHAVAGLGDEVDLIG